jgi:RHS repeat-associated protein
MRDANGFAPSGSPDGTLEETMYYLTDANHNVTALMDGSRDGSGAFGPRAGQVVERYVYDPYGRVTVLNGASDADSPANGPAVAQWSPDADDLSAAAGTGTASDRIGDWDNEILYAGYRYDPATGLYHVRHRAYDVELAWLQRDPAEDGPNVYSYCMGCPIGSQDPYGLTTWTSARSTEEVQRIVGAKPDGIYGKETTAKVAAFQKLLIDKGYLAGQADGKWGERTEAAFKWYDECQDLRRRKRFAVQQSGIWANTATEIAKIYIDAERIFYRAEIARRAGHLFLTNIFGGNIDSPDIFGLAEAAWSAVEQAMRAELEKAGMATLMSGIQRLHVRRRGLHVLSNT